MGFGKCWSGAWHAYQRVSSGRVGQGVGVWFCMESDAWVGGSTGILCCCVVLFVCLYVCVYACLLSRFESEILVELDGVLIGRCVCFLWIGG